MIGLARRPGNAVAALSGRTVAHRKTGSTTSDKSRPERMGRTKLTTLKRHDLNSPWVADTGTTDCQNIVLAKHCARK